MMTDLAPSPVSEQILPIIHVVLDQPIQTQRQSFINRLYSLAIQYAHNVTKLKLATGSSLATVNIYKNFN